MHALENTKAYLAGAMQYENGRSWRDYVTKKLSKLNVTCWNPYSTPFVADVNEDEEARDSLNQKLVNKEFDFVAQHMKEVRRQDLSLVDRADFLIVYINPKVPSWGTAEELVTGVRKKSPIFIAIEGGKHLCPLWVLGMLPHHYVYDSVKDVVKMIKKIDSGKQPIDSTRWRLLKKEYR